MENSQFVKLLIPVLISGFFVFNINYVFAYDIETHAYLTAEIIDFYNKNFPKQQINDELKNYLIDGSRREDDPVRWMNHFYDPVYNRGLTIDFSTFSLKDVASVSFVNLTNMNSSWLPSKDWAQDSNSQNELKYSPSIATILSSLQSEKIQKYFPTSDFSWREAIRYWIQGDGEMAMFALGHILHLIEDKTVPDHTRNDPHPGDSPYELYTQQFSLSNPDKNLSGRLKNKQPVILEDLNSYFDATAKYANNGFYSKDTVGIQSGYNLPQPDYYQPAADGKTYWIKSDRESGDYYLSAAPPKLIWFTLNSQELLSSDYIKNDYWARLSVKSLQYGAGVINLFFQEAEKAKNNPDFAKKSAEEEKKSFFAQIGSVINGAASSVGNFFSGIFSDDENPPQIVENNANQIAAALTLSSNNQNSPSGSASDPTTLTPVENSPVNQSNNRLALLSELQAQLNEISNKANVLNQQVQVLASQPFNVSPSPVIFAVGGGGGGEGGGTVKNTEQNFTETSTTTSTDSTASSTDNLIATSSDIISTSSQVIEVEHIVISEILFDAEGNDKGKEFIELYNPATSTIDLNSWSLRYFRENSTSVKSLAVFGAKSEDITLIPAQGFLLIGLNDYEAENYSGIAADIVRDENLPNGSEKTIVILYDGENNEIDRIIYDKNSITNEGESLERMAWENNQCVSAQNSGELLGNGCFDNKEDDFSAEGGLAAGWEIREAPNPQNSSSLPEPRNAPTAPRNFNIQYSSSTSELIFNWLESQDYNGSTSTLIYEIKEVNNAFSSLPIIVIETASTSAAIAISELDRNYEFDILARDKDGLESATSSADIYVDAPQIPSTQILLSQLDESSSSLGYAWLYQEFGNGISGKLQNLEFKMYTGNACQWFHFQEFNDAGYSQLSREFSSVPKGNSEPDFVVRLADGSLWNYSTCESGGGGNIMLEFNNDIKLIPDKYYRLYFETGDASRSASFSGSDFDAGFGNFKGCNLKSDVANGIVFRWKDCYTPNFDIYFVLKGTKIDNSDLKNENDLPTQQ